MALHNDLRHTFVNAEMNTQVPQVNHPTKYAGGYVQFSKQLYFLKATFR